MNPAWYINRLGKMSAPEMLKRTGEQFQIHWSRIKHRKPELWPYARFADGDLLLDRKPLDAFATPSTGGWGRYRIYDFPVDLTGAIDWHFSPGSDTRWPATHFAGIDYRPGNRCGDVRINWELNRLQFLPAMAGDNEDLAKRILSDWMEKNRFLQGPAYIASMEVALRWISIYHCACLFKKPLEKGLLKNLAGLAVASGRFIQSRLSTHSSAGNHLIVEAVGLFWIGKALANHRIGQQWIRQARTILHREILKQIHPDGSSVEQSFWYLGFVLDAIFHYYLLEERGAIASDVWKRVGRAVAFIDDMTLPGGGYPDFGDRDDGVVLRPHSDYQTTPFPRLLATGASFYGSECAIVPKSSGPSPTTLKVYPHGGMTLMKQGPGRLLFRHAPLGMESLFGHGHADALSILFWWNDVPVLIDPGSGQYNGDQRVRDYFRATIAHNTVELGGRNQAAIKGPFMWEKSYRSTLHEARQEPWIRVNAGHDGYVEPFATLHHRAIEWRDNHRIDVTDRFFGPGGVGFRAAFHLGPNAGVRLESNALRADFGRFSLRIEFPAFVEAAVARGSQAPFIGWHSALYGTWHANWAILFSGVLKENHAHTFSLHIEPH
jgi:hypothetical protein